MAFNLFFKRSSGLLEKILSTPGNYSTERIKLAVLKACAPGYNHSVEELRIFCKRIGLLDQLEALTQRIAEDVLAGKLETIEVVKGSFALQFDNELAQCYFKGGANRTHLDTFFLTTFRTYEHDGKFKALCVVKAERTDAFFDALSAFLEMLGRTEVLFERGARALFKEMFRLQCATQTRSALTEKNQRNNRYLDFIFEDFPPEVRAKLTQPPTMLLGYDLAQLERFNAGCLDLIYRIKVMGYKYAELTEELDRTAEQLRRDLLNCKQKFRRAFGDLVE